MKFHDNYSCNLTFIIISEILINSSDTVNNFMIVFKNLRPLVKFDGDTLKKSAILTKFPEISQKSGMNQMWK